MLDNEVNEPFKFGTKKWVEIKYDARLTYNTNRQIKFKTIILKSSLCDYSDAYILVKGSITITGDGVDDTAKRADEIKKDVILKNCPPFTECISKKNNFQVDNTKDLDVVMSMYNLIKYSNNYSKTWECLGNFVEMRQILL